MQQNVTQCCRCDCLDHIQTSVIHYMVWWSHVVFDETLSSQWPWYPLCSRILCTLYHVIRPNVRQLQQDLSYLCYLSCPLSSCVINKHSHTHTHTPDGTARLHTPHRTRNLFLNFLKSSVPTVHLHTSSQWSITGVCCDDQINNAWIRLRVRSVLMFIVNSC